MPPMPELNPLTARRVLPHLDDGRRVPLDTAEIFLFEAKGDETVVRTGGRPLRDVRSLGELMQRVPLGVFVLIHRALAVNVDRVAEVRRRPGERDWELRLEPPVNRVLPVARGRAQALWAAYGERGPLDRVRPHGYCRCRLPTSGCNREGVGCARSRAAATRRSR